MAPEIKPTVWCDECEADVANWPHDSTCSDYPKSTIVFCPVCSGFGCEACDFEMRIPVERVPEVLARRMEAQNA